MQYMFLVYTNEKAFQSMAAPQREQAMGAYIAYTEALRKAGALKPSDRLRRSSDGTSVRIESGKSQVLDGPYAHTKEQLGGFYIVDLPDLDAALSWAARCPGASHGTVEVRPIWTNS